MSDAIDLATRYLHEAVKKQQFDLVKSFLSQPNGMDVNVRDGYGMTALMWAAGRGYQDMVLLLLQRRADVDARNELLSVKSIEKLETGKSDYWADIDRMAMLHANKHHGWTALAWAARNGQTEIVNLLLDNGANINAITKDGFTSLVHAIDTKHIETAHLLLKRGANPDLLEDDCSPALPIAAQHGLIDLVQAILDQGGSISVIGNYGHTASINAIVGNHAEVLTLLLEHGVDVNAAYPEDGKIQLLHIAAIHDAVECARILLDHGANINAKDELNGLPALMFALDEIQGPRVACLLIERGADTQGALERAELYKDSEESSEDTAEIIEMLKARTG